MRHRRTLVTLCSFVILAILAGLSLTEPGLRPAAAQQATGFTVGEGLANPLLSGWQQVQIQGHIAGRYSEVLTAPLCSSQNSLGCQSASATTAHQVELTVERATSEATAAGDELPAILDQLGFTRTAATIDGQPATRFTAPKPNQLGYQVLVLEVQGVYYHLAFDESFRATPELIDQILAGFALRPAEAPAPFIASGSSGNVPPSPTPALGANPFTIYLPIISHASALAQTQPATMKSSARLTIAQATGTGLSWGFNREQMAQQAAYYGPQYTNPGDNYVHPTADGAHFIDCMLRAVGLPGARCNGAGDSYFWMNDLYTFVTGVGAQPTTAPIRGDVLFLHDGINYCWGGVVVEVSGGSVYVATHTQYYSRVSADSLLCNNPNGTGTIVPRQKYIHLDGEAPSVTFLTPDSGKRHPGDTLFSYQGTDAGGSGLLGFTLRYWKDGALTVLATKTPSTTWTGGLNFPCRAVTAEVVAHDRIGNVNEALGDSRTLSILVRGDVNADGVIDQADLDLLTEAEGLATGQSGFSPALDPTGDGRVDAADRLLVQRRMSETCPQP